MTEPDRGAASAAGAGHRVCAVALLLLACLGLFASLDDRLLWGDEAETALLAANVTRYGVPRSDDGHKLVSHRGVRDSNEDGIWIWSPWLDEYLVAASFLAMGVSTFSARFPFALAGLGTLLLLGALAQRVYRDPELSLTAVALLSTCVPFLLLARQCRYYALVMLAIVWLAFGYQKLVERDRRGALHIALSLTMLFYSNYVTVPGALLGLLAASALQARHERSVLLGAALGVAGFAALALPWLFYAGFADQASALSTQRFAESLGYYLGELHFHVLPWIIFALPAIALAARKLGSLPSEAPVARSGREIEVLILCIALLQLLVLSLSPFRFFRYLAPLIPLLMLVSAAILQRHLQPAWLRRSFVLLLCTSNLLAVVSAFPLAGRHPLGSPQARFASSLLQSYDDRLEDVVNFLEREATADESLLVPDPEFPLAFHTGMRVADARLRGAWPPAPPHPDWILVTSPSAIAEAPPLVLPTDLRSSYRAIELEVRRSQRGGGRPDPHAYELFRSEETEPLTLYRRRR